jgi:pyruvate-formate lyase
MLDLAEVCDVVPEHAPQTFRQAIQMYWFTHIGVTVEMNNWDAYSPGKVRSAFRAVSMKRISRKAA